MSELRTIARHAGTVLVGQLAVMAFGVTDTVVAGRYADTALAALSVGTAVYVTVFVALTGMMQVLLPIWAELRGARRLEDVGRSVRQALYLSAMSMGVGVIALFFPNALLAWTEVPVDLQADVRSYLAVIALALPPTLLVRMFATLNQSLGHPRVMTLLQAGSLVVKVPLTIWLAFGGLGVPPLGVVGCAWATVIVQYLFLGVTVWLLRHGELYEPYAIWRPMEPPDWHAIGQFLRLGVPAGLSFLVEVTSFTMMALFIARQGTAASAAHQIASNIATILYMIPLSIAIATSARVSYWLGAGDPKRARSVIRTGFRLGLSLAVAASAFVWIGRSQLATIYTSDEKVLSLAGVVLAWLAFFHLGDAVQALCVFVLRCYRVTVAPLVAYTVLLWGIGTTGGYLLAYRGMGPWPAQWSPAAFWQASSFALAVLAIILPLILWRAVRRYQPA